SSRTSEWTGSARRSRISSGSTRRASLSLPDGLVHVQTVAREVADAAVRAVRPGMTEIELRDLAEQLLREAGCAEVWSITDIGHSLRRGSAYDEKFIDATNGREMWGAWAIEPFLGTDRFGVKLEDLVWFGSDGCVVLR